MGNDSERSRNPGQPMSADADSSRATEDAVRRVLAYHATSKHHLDRYAPGPRGLDWATQPDPFRTFAGAPRIELALRADRLAATFAAVRAGVRPPPWPVDLDGAAALLELSLGLSAWKEYGGSRWALRCNPSSGNLHPTEAYVVCPALPGLPRGIHHYVSRDHALEQRARVADAAAHWDAALDGRILVVLGAIHWREAWKYGVRAWRYGQHDCGHAIAAVAYAAATLGWHAEVVADADDATLGALVGIDREADFADAEEEVAEVAIVVGGTIATKIDLRSLRIAPLEFAGRANRLSPSRIDWPDIDDVERATRRTVVSDAPATRVTRELSRASPALPPLGSATPTPAQSFVAAATLIRQRRSAVDFDGVTTLDAEAWFAMLDALLPRPHVPPLDAWPHAPRVHPTLFVHRVDGVEPGLCVLAREPSAVAELRRATDASWDWSPEPRAPAHLPLWRLAHADVRDAARAISCHQDIAADSCFSLGFVADFRDVRQSPWAYRQLFRETGILGQILYLEAEAAGLRGTGIGCFFDEAMHRLLGLQGERWQSLYHFTVGGPLEDRRLRTHLPYSHLGR